MFDRKQWIGPKQIDTAEEIPDRKDFAGNPLWKVKYIQGGVEYFTKPMLEGIVTDKTSDLTDLRLRRCHLMVQGILKVFSKYGFKIKEFDYLYQVLKGTLEIRTQQATDIAFGVNEFDLSILDVASILEQHKLDVKAGS